jgi:outer membrane protein OmpA-like peptidoglycan-associated protein
MSRKWAKAIGLLVISFITCGEAAALGLAPQGTYVFFAPNSADISQAEKARVSAFFKQYGPDLEFQKYVDRAICIDGHADGSEPADTRLSDRRSKVVKEFLIDFGLPREHMFTRALGREEPLIAYLPPGTARAENRNVSVRFNTADCKPYVAPKY